MTHLPTQLVQKLLSRHSARGLLAVALCGAGTLALTPAAALGEDDQGSFWTTFTPSEDTRLIFVSSSAGNDANSGLSPSEPVKTLARGYELLRDGYPDWMLLKRGDSWYTSMPNWGKSGRAEDEKLVVGAYGDGAERPQVRPESGQNGLNGPGMNRPTVSHVAFVGFHLEPQDRRLDDGGTGVGWIRNSEDILFEDLFVGGFATNFVLQADGDGTVLRDYRVNGCVIADSWSNSSHSQGLFAKGIEGLTIENSVFDHNGWNPALGVEPTAFNQNVYIQYTCRDVSAVNNVFLRASGAGLQMRAGGEIRDNLFIANPVGLLIGAPFGYNLGYGVDAIVSNNVMLDGVGMQNSAQTPSSIGIYVHNAKVVSIHDNILSSNELGYNGQAIRVTGSDNGDDAIDLDIYHNALVAWNGSIQVSGQESPNDDDSIAIRENYIAFDFDASNGVSSFNKSIHKLTTTARNCTFDSNTYRYYGTHSRPFMFGSAVTVESWESIYEPSGHFFSISSRPDSYSIDVYMSHIGAGGDVAEFAELARQFSRHNQSPLASPQAVRDWIRADLGNWTD